MSRGHNFTKQQVEDFRVAFKAWDSINTDNKLDSRELGKVMTELGNFSENELKDIILKADKDGDGELDFDEFLQACWDNKTALRTLADKQVDLIQVKRAGSILHTFAQEEMTAFAEHLNYVLGDDKGLKHVMPIETEGMDLCTKIKDGVLLSKFINCACPDTIDMRAVNKPKKGKKLSLFQQNENNNLVINAAKSIGVKVVNIGASDLAEGHHKPHLILGIVWQLVKIQLLQQINLKAHPELIRLLEEDETLEDLLALPAEQLLLRWFNYHLKQAGSKRKVRNFGNDVCDSECYTVLLNQLNPKKCDKKPMSEKNLMKRADGMLGNARKLGVKVFIKPEDVIAKNERLNLAFTASVFNHCPGLDPPTAEEEKMAGMMDDDVGDSREERAFRMWINTLGIEDVYINNLFDDCKDGLVLLKVMDKISPGLVHWKKVEKKPKNKFKKVANCNYVVVLAKSLKLSLPATGGVDITDGNKKLTLGLVWQLMRYHSIKFLSKLTNKDGKPITDKQIVAWCNKKVAQGGGDVKIGHFRDKALKDGKYFIYVIDSVWKGTVDWDIVTDGDNEEDAINNARYALSVARMKNCTIFLLPEDIYECKPRMCMTFGAALMTEAKNSGKD